jgi:spore maturation protein CgeB
MFGSTKVYEVVSSDVALRILYHGGVWPGSTSLQRVLAFQQLDGVTTVSHDTGARVGKTTNLWFRIRWKLRWPVDTLDENLRLLDVTQRERPDVVIVDNSKVISRRTLIALRALGVSRLVYYSPDDIIAKHNLSFPIKYSLSEWDIVFTTKTFNVPELRALGVKRPVFVGKAYDRTLHLPAGPSDVGLDYEKFDVVFIGTYEKERCASINAVAEAGYSVVVYGSDKGGWCAERLHPKVELRKSVFGEDYRIAWHTGKIALCFLRKINRDRITQRTMEIAAMGRPMVAEKTDEHDQHFIDGTEYLGFTEDAVLIERVRFLLDQPDCRNAMGLAARLRCETSGYSTLDRALQMMRAIRSEGHE